MKIDNSEIAAEGEKAELTETEAKEYQIIGSGGGSGGSIQIITTKLQGDGYLSVKGGSGSIGGGGGGSGGRIVIYFLGNYLADFSHKWSFDWIGKLNLLGGEQGPLTSQFEYTTQSERFASNGTEWHPKC